MIVIYIKDIMINTFKSNVAVLFMDILYIHSCRAMWERHLLIRLQSNGHTLEHLNTENILVLSVLLCAFLFFCCWAPQQVDNNCHGVVKNKTSEIMIPLKNYSVAISLSWEHYGSSTHLKHICAIFSNHSNPAYYNLLWGKNTHWC